MFARIRKAQENNEGGFTLIELLVVMIIIGILAAIAIPAFLNQKKKANETAAKSDATNIAKELAAAAVDGPWSTAVPSIALVSGNVWRLTYRTTADSAAVTADVKVSAGNTPSIVAASTALGTTNYCVTVTPATDTGSPWTASQAGLAKGTTCPS